METAIKRDDRWIRLAGLFSLLGSTLLSAGLAAAQVRAAAPQAASEPYLFRGTTFAPDDVKPTPERYGDPAHADLSGVWSPQRGGVARFDFTKVKIPLTPLYAAKLADYRRRLDAGNPPSDSITDCIAVGFPRFLTLGFELIQTPGQVTMVSAQMWNVRKIYTDGRGHSPDIDLTYNGDSVGHWDGDTLVVETDHVHANFMDDYGIPYSDKLTAVERIRRTAANHLQIEMTLTDADALTHPFTYTWDYGLQPPGSRMEEAYCDNNRNRGVDGVQQARTRQRTRR